MKLATLRLSRSAARWAAALTGGETRKERTAVFRLGRGVIKAQHNILRYAGLIQAYIQHMYGVLHNSRPAAFGFQ